MGPAPSASFPARTVEQAALHEAPNGAVGSAASCAEPPERCDAVGDGPWPPRPSCSAACRRAATPNRTTTDRPPRGASSVHPGPPLGGGPAGPPAATATSTPPPATRA